MTTSRLEAFSDGVLAIAITLLAIEIHPPELYQGERLAQALWAQWPSYVAYLVSFLTIGVIWLNHHRVFDQVARVDGPLLLVATVVLSFAAALGVSALVFNHLFGFAGADPSFPLWTFVFLVALGTDYNIFLMTRVHEEAKVHGTRRGALIGLAATGGVITSAGIVLAGTFAALGTLPLVFITEIGFAVAFGVLLDTFVVRSVLVTALNLDVGRWIWWPSRLHHKHDVALGELEPEQAEIRR